MACESGDLRESFTVLCVKICDFCLSITTGLVVEKFVLNSQAFVYKKTVQ